MDRPQARGETVGSMELLKSSGADGEPSPASRSASYSTDGVGGVPAIELVGIRKSFHSRRGVVAAVDGVDLIIGEGEFFSLLGPSGCGKTTMLRMIGGFEEPTSGQILLYGKDVVGVPPNHRDVNMVFQSYALFPHMSVFDNVAFGLRRKSTSKSEITRRVGEMLDLPLAALDLKLRQAMQIELKRIQREVVITFVFVTHDQNEALTMSDRLVVMSAGRIEQLGAPREVYERPRTRFVAGFIGTSNLMTGRVRELDGATAVLDCGVGESLLVPGATDVGAGVGAELDLTVRPEKIVISPDTPTAGWCALRGRVAEVVYLGTSTQYAVTIGDGTELSVFVQNSSDANDVADRDSDVWLSWRPDHSLVLAGGPSASNSSPDADHDLAED